MRAANWATTSATRVCPTATTAHSQMPTGPAVPEHVVVGGEDSHRDGDERERDREHLERAEGSFQLWFVAAIRHSSSADRASKTFSAVIRTPGLPLMS